LIDTLEIKRKEDTPYVFMDADEGFIKIKGKSFPSDITGFYTPILEWLERYKNEGEKELNVNFLLDYFNTASSKIFLDFFYKLEEIDQLGKKIIINWYYPEDDDEILDIGEEYEGLVDIEFRHIAYEQEL